MKKKIPLLKKEKIYREVSVLEIWLMWCTLSFSLFQCLNRIGNTTLAKKMFSNSFRKNVFKFEYNKINKNLLKHLHKKGKHEGIMNAVLSSQRLK